ncbi:MAG TPA: hypothetical protein VHB02_05775 [Acidimicrobiales bacterium]|nr:hypothetical protein [Acidimicrobiales bacterium]
MMLRRNSASRRRYRRLAVQPCPTILPPRPPEVQGSMSDDPVRPETAVVGQLPG